MNEINQKLSFLTRRDQYLKLPRTPKLLVPFIILMALVGLLIFAFFGRLTTTYTGLSYEVNDHAYLLIPYPYRDIISPDTQTCVWIGSEKGTLIHVIDDMYVTEESIADMQYFQAKDNPYFDSNMTYLLGTAVFDNSLPRTGTYKVVLETVRPIDLILEGIK